MSPRRTTLPELGRFPPKVLHLRASPRWPRTRAAGPEPQDRWPQPLPPARPRTAPTRRPAPLAAAPRRRACPRVRQVPRGARPGPPGRGPEWQSGLPGQPLPAADRPMAPLALPRALLALPRDLPRQRAGPPQVQPPLMPAHWPGRPCLPGKMQLPSARPRVPRGLPPPSCPRSAGPLAARSPPWAGCQGRALSAG